MNEQETRKPLLTVEQAVAELTRLEGQQASMEKVIGPTQRGEALRVALRRLSELGQENEKLRVGLHETLIEANVGVADPGKAFGQCIGVGNTCRRVLRISGSEGLPRETPVLSEAGGAPAERVDRIPSHSSQDLPRYIQINRQPYRVNAEKLAGAALRDIPIPAISSDYDLWKYEPFGPDTLVADDDVIDLRGARFYMAPKIINAGSEAGGAE